MSLVRDPLSIAVLGHLHHPVREPFEGGLEAHTAQVCAALAARGHRVTLFAKAGSEVAGTTVVPVVDAAFEWGPHNAPDDEARLDAATAEACRLARGHDAVLNNTLNPVPYTALPDAAVLTVLHTPATLERVEAVVRAPGWRPGPRHAWVSVSESNAVGWRALLPDVEVGVVHNGIDPSVWRYQDSPGAHLVWSARITPEKGLHVAMDAAAAAGRELRIAGPVSNPDYFADEIAPRLESRPSAHYLGHLDHQRLAQLLGGAAAFLCTPLWPEPFGFAPLEAMACGTPVAALANGALPEVLGAAGGQLAADVDDLVRAIGAAVRMDRAAVRHRAEQFSQEAMVSRYEALLTRLAAGRPACGPDARADGRQRSRRPW